MNWFGIVFVRARSRYVICIQITPKSCAWAESSQRGLRRIQNMFRFVVFMRKLWGKGGSSLDIRGEGMGRKPCEVVQKGSGERAPAPCEVRRAAQQITLSAGGSS